MEQFVNGRQTLFVGGQLLDLLEVVEQPFAIGQRTVDLIHQGATLILHRPARLIAIDGYIELVDALTQGWSSAGVHLIQDGTRLVYGTLYTAFGGFG